MPFFRHQAISDRFLIRQTAPPKPEFFPSANQPCRNNPLPRSSAQPILRPACLRKKAIIAATATTNGNRSFLFSQSSFPSSFLILLCPSPSGESTLPIDLHYLSTFLLATAKTRGRAFWRVFSFAASSNSSVRTQSSPQNTRPQPTNLSSFFPQRQSRMARLLARQRPVDRRCRLPFDSCISDKPPTKRNFVIGKAGFRTCWQSQQLVARDSRRADLPSAKAVFPCPELPFSHFLRGFRCFPANFFLTFFIFCGFEVDTFLEGG